MKLIREMPGLFRLVRFAPVNSYFVREDDGLTLVDANLPGRAEKIVEKALRMELPIKRIALTHAHMDHVGSLDAICQLVPSAEVFIGARESRLMEQDFSLDPDEPKTKLRGRFPVVKTRPSLLDPGDHVGSLRVLATPGHTPGHVSFSMSATARCWWATRCRPPAAWPWRATCDCCFPCPRSLPGTSRWRSKARGCCAI